MTDRNCEYVRRFDEPLPADVMADAAQALRHAAKVIELYDDATMRADYMIDSGECAGILNALAEYHARAAEKGTT